MMDNIYELISGIAGIVTLGLVIVLYLRERPTGLQLDQKASDELDARRANRELMAFWERAYQETGAMNKQVLDAALGFLKLIAPLTPLKTDDSAVRLLEDIQTPGAPVEPATPAADPIDPNAVG